MKIWRKFEENLKLIFKNFAKNLKNFCHFFKHHFNPPSAPHLKDIYLLIFFIYSYRKKLLSKRLFISNTRNEQNTQINNIIMKWILFLLHNTMRYNIIYLFIAKASINVEIKIEIEFCALQYFSAVFVCDIFRMFAADILKFDMSKNETAEFFLLFVRNAINKFEYCTVFDTFLLSERDCDDEWLKKIKYRSFEGKRIEDLSVKDYIVEDFVEIIEF